MKCEPKKTAAMAYIEKMNPLQGLSIRDAQAIFDSARGGNTQRLHWIFANIEMANPVLMTCVERRAAAISNFSWAVTERANADQVLSAAQKAAVENLINGIDNFTDLFEHLDLAFFRGFSYAQPEWNADWSCSHIRLLNSWRFFHAEDKSTGELLLKYDQEGTGNIASATDCSSAMLIGVSRKRCIDFPALSIVIRDALGERDWGRFVERYALPKPAVMMHPQATDTQRADYIAAAAAVENGQVSVWPNGANLMDFAGGSRGTDPCEGFVTHQEKLLLLLSTGGTLTSLAEADTGSLAGGAQMDVWREICLRDSNVLAQAIQKALVKPFLAACFPGQPIAVDFAFDATRKPSAKEVLEMAALARNAGYSIAKEELEEATGFTLTEAPVAQEFPTMMNKEPAKKTPEDILADALAEAMVEELKKETK